MSEKSTMKEVIPALHKAFGKTSIVKLGENIVWNNDTFSTGSLTLDQALSGGIVKGRTVEVYGGEASGKCYGIDTYIYSPNGLLTIGEIFKNNGVEPSCTNKTIEKNILLYNRDSELEMTTHFTCNGRKRIKKITTRTGRVIKATFNNPLLVMSENGNLVWKVVDTLTEKDYLVCARKDNLFFGKENLDKDMSYLLGILIADGCFQKSSLYIANDDESIKEFIESKVCTLLGFNKYLKYNKNIDGSIDYRFNNKKVVDNFYKTYSLKQGLAKDKIIPKIIRMGDYETVKSFIQGYVDCESYVCDDRGIEVCSASYTLLYDLKLLLEFFGIVSFLHPKKVKNYEDNNYYRLTIAGQDAINFIEKIGTRSKKVLDRYDSFLNHRKENIIQTNHDSIPYLSGLLRDLYLITEDTNRVTCKICKDYCSNRANLTYDRLQKILDVSDNCFIKNYLTYLNENKFYFDKINYIEEIESEPTFDFAMSKTHSFIANGIISHNTTLALHMIAEAQKTGEVAFIDVEHTFDPKYAKAIGLNVNNLWFSQPDSAEEAFEIIEALAQTEEINMIVVDSVAALVPLQEVEGDSGDSNMGKIARLMSQHLRKVTPIASKCNTTIIYINQLRMKIGVSWGNPETTPGGLALKYHSSVRLDVRRRETIKDKDKQAIGIVTKVKVAKNKTGPPLREAEFTILYGQGIDHYGEIFDLALNKKVIISKGSWFSFEENQIGQGKENVILKLKEDKELYNKIMEKI